MIELALICIAAAAALVGGGIAAVAVYRLDRMQAGIAAWLTPDAEGQLPIMELVTTGARAAVQSRNNSAAAEASGESRRELAASADLIEKAVTAQWPEAAIIATQMFGPTWARTFAKNPAYFAALQKMGPGIMSMLRGAGNGQSKAKDNGQLSLANFMPDHQGGIING